VSEDVRETGPLPFAVSRLARRQMTRTDRPCDADQVQL